MIKEKDALKGRLLFDMTSYYISISGEFCYGISFHSCIKSQNYINLNLNAYFCLHFKVQSKYDIVNIITNS